ncbi:FAD-binding and (Fe-S)-binding domain-containing protein [Motilibacter deserti]|uniref:FAD-binding and (Fe-S)-binding domain-containing protein n=1 Tax=Motilibacter deserti TaxID=2714956 RepID=UPI00140E5A6E
MPNVRQDARVPGAPYVDVRGLREELERRVDAEVRFDPGSRGAYSTDASNYRQVPIGVVVPRSVEAAVEAVAVCRELGAPVLSRGGGTSLAGQACNVAVVIDWSKHCNRLLSVDPVARTCAVEPGIVLDELNRQLAAYGLQFGPKPATHANCTLGGMIGNDSCGASAQGYGRTVDNVRRLEVLTYGGLRFWAGPLGPGGLRADLPGELGRLHSALAQLRDRHADEVRDRFPDIPRRVSGYSLDALLPEGEVDLARLLVGTEGTLVTVLRAELALVPLPAATALAVLAYPDLVAAARAVPPINEHRPIALEGFDAELVEFQRDKHLEPEVLGLLPPGGAYLMAQFAGDTPAEAAAQAEALVRTAGRATPSVVLRDRAHQRQLWQIREAGLGATAHVPGRPDTHPGWEDSAVAPERLADYLRDLKALLVESGYEQHSVYGHFGHGCVHARIPFDLRSDEGVRAFRRFLERAADLVAAYGGSLSGEHGDGQARGELLDRMFGPRLVRAFGELKAAFDPLDRMNPGKVVAPYALDADLRLLAPLTPPPGKQQFGYPHDGGSVVGAAARCVGVGKCRSHVGGVMCPSYRATGEEEHSTRGRARLLFELMRDDGTVREDGWRSPDVLRALDLCLACKGCKTDCPVNVDMAAYKAEFLSHHYAGRLRPRAHYAMGWLPVWLRAATRAPRVVNAVASAPLLSRGVKWAGGIAQQRTLPQVADERFSSWYARRGPRGDGPRGDGRRGEVLLWPDTFTDALAPQVGRAAVEVLEDAGFRVVLPEGPLCCGLTWVTTGQLDVARRVLRRAVDALRPHLDAGRPVVGLEPSCTAVFRADSAELFPDDPDVERLRQATVTLGELFAARAPEWRPPAAVGGRAVVQRHCHQYAVMGYDADAELLRRAGAEVEVLDAGCCGLAGDFGFTNGHYEVSQAVAEHALLPRLRRLGAEEQVLADGFSCRTQVEQSDVTARPRHAAELLAAAVRGAEGPPPSGASAGRDGLAADAVAVGALVLAGAAVARRLAR